MASTITNNDPVNHPKHYTQHPSGVECIEITEHFNFNLGNAIKYIWRSGLKNTDAITDLRKAAFYLDREIKLLQRINDAISPTDVQGQFEPDYKDQHPGGMRIK